MQILKKENLPFLYFFHPLRNDAFHSRAPDRFNGTFPGTVKLNAIRFSNDVFFHLMTYLHSCFKEVVISATVSKPDR